MHKQHRQYVILVVVLLACASSVFFGVRSILHSNDEVTTFAVGDWEGITLPRYYGPAVYSSPAQQGYSVTLPMASTSSRSLFHHSVAPSYRAAVATTQRVQTSAAAYKVHQTSDQVARYVGAGSGSAGSASLGTTNVQQSAASASFSIPTLELTTLSVRTHTLANNNIIAVNDAATSSPVLVTASDATSKRAIRHRRVTVDGDGEYDGEIDGNQIWDDYIREWIDMPSDGDPHPHNPDLVWDENAGGWRPKSDLPEPGTPIGDIPWLMFLMALIAYSTCRVVKKKENR